MVIPADTSRNTGLSASHIQSTMWDVTSSGCTQVSMREKAWVGTKRQAKDEVSRIMKGIFTACSNLLPLIMWPVLNQIYTVFTVEPSERCKIACIIVVTSTA